VNVLGLDISSFTVALALLDENENENRASNIIIELPGKTSFDRLRQVAQAMPQPGWYAANDVYLAAAEMPKSKFFPSLAAQLPVYGAVIASLPDDLLVWSLKPADWKTPLGLHGKAKPTRETFEGFELDGDWQIGDALDALGVALYARDTNARAIARTLAAPT
jgi:hypothetical protein